VKETTLIDLKANLRDLKLLAMVPDRNDNRKLTTCANPILTTPELG